MSAVQTRRGLLGFLLGAPVAAVAANAPTARQTELFTQLSRAEINKPGLGNGIERDSNLIETRLALHEYRIRHGKGHWRLYQSPVGSN